MRTRNGKSSSRHSDQVVAKVTEGLAARLSLPHTSKPTTCDINLRAYQRWEEAGKPICDGVQFWLEAESELISLG